MSSFTRLLVATEPGAFQPPPPSLSGPATPRTARLGRRLVARRLDHLAGRASEIDAINGMVPVIGARHGIATPVNETLSALVRAIEARF